MTALTPAGPSSLDDAAALTRYAATGDPSAFEVLVYRYQSMVLATCRRTLRNDSDAEDATQEAFLRLAQHAGTITSNAAAWLHACALRASLDLLRKKGSARRVEREATVSASANTDPADADPRALAGWREIEPLLDAALAELDEADRELIVGRFLAGRSQTDLAREAGVNPGTIHRRLEKALDRLRTKLTQSGLADPGVALGAALTTGLTAGLAGAATSAVSPALTGSLVKAGLVGLARRPESSSLSSGAGTSTASAGLLGSTAGKATVVAAAAIVGVGLLAAGALTLASMTNAMNNSMAGSMNTTSAADANALLASRGTGRAVERPTRASRRYPMSSFLVSGAPSASMRIAGDTIVYEEYRDESWRPLPQTARATMKILDARLEKGVERMTLRVHSSTFDDGHDLTELLGKAFEATWSVEQTPDGELVRIVAENPPGMNSGGDNTANDRTDDPRTDDPRNIGMEWTGVRPPAWHPDADEPTGNAPLTPGLGGVWFEVEPFELILSESDITMKWGDWTAHRFRVLSWKAGQTSTRIQAICGNSMNPAMPGERVKLLLRQEETGGYTLVMHDQYSDKLNEWPAGFGLNPETTVISFRKETP